MYVEKVTLENRCVHPCYKCINCLNVNVVKMKTEEGIDLLQCFCLCDFYHDRDGESRACQLLNEELSGKSVNDNNYSKELRKLLKIRAPFSYTRSPRYVDENDACHFYQGYF